MSNDLDPSPVFIHPTVGYETYVTGPDTYANYWPSPGYRPRVTLHCNEGGIGLIVETVPVASREEAIHAIRRMSAI